MQLSKTQVKNGSRVEAAIIEVGAAKQGSQFCFVTVREVAKSAGMSKPTVQKYIDILIMCGVMEEVKRDMRYCTAKTTRMFRWLGTLIPAEVE